MTVNHGVPGSSPGGGAKPKVTPSAFLFIAMVYSVYILYSTKLGVHYIGTRDDWSPHWLIGH